MEECPRCGARLESYTLFGRTAWNCERCGYADIPVEHQRESGARESWQDALNRFYDKHREDE
ncbi:MAG TPA: transposase [Natrialbaceae archaeon]|nr:transposase [Natrialbaceae archaeon]